MVWKAICFQKAEYLCYSNSARKGILAVMSQCHQSCSMAAKAERRLYCQIRIDLLVPNFLIFDIGDRQITGMDPLSSSIGQY